MKKILLLLLMLLFLPIVYAAPPFNDVEISTTEGDWSIFYPNFIYYPYGNNIRFDFHVFDGNGTLVTNETASASFFLTDHKGVHIFEVRDTVKMDSNMVDWEVTVDKYNFTEGEDYLIFFHINNSVKGAGVHFGFEVTKTGKEDVETQSIILGLGIVAFLLLYFGFSLTPEHVILKLLCFCLFVSLLYLISVALLNGPTILISFINICTWFFRAFFTYMFIYLIILAYKKVHSEIPK